MVARNMKLRFLCAVTRHGERAPTLFLPNDPNREYFEDGANNLTKNGKMEMYNLGRVLRARYDHFLGDKPLARTVHVRSTDVDRCLVSAQCVLASLYPPVDDEDKLTPELTWQPVPVHTMPGAIDPFAIRLPEKFRHPPNGIYKNPALDERYTTMMKHQELWKHMDTISKSKGHFKHITAAIDTVLNESSKELAIPEELEERVEDLNDLFFATVELHCVTHIESLLPTATILDELVRKMDRFLEDFSTPKTSIYSLHDMNTIPLIAVLTKDIMRCPVGCCVLFELYEDVATPDDFYVKVLFLNKHDEDPLELKLRLTASSADTLVSFGEFKKFVHDFVVDTLELDQRTARLSNSQVQYVKL